MGFDKLLSFFTKNLQNNIVEDLYNKPLVVANHVYFDMNFVIYNSISIIENDINTIYKMIFALPYSSFDKIKLKLNNVLSTYYWEKALKPHNINILEIFDGNNITIMIDCIKTILDKYIYDILYWHVFDTISQYISRNHPIQFIQSINIFFDGIPTYAKMVEQRRRRMKNYIDSKNRKKIFNEYFDKIVHNLVSEDDITFDYFEWLKYLYTFDKAIGPYSDIMVLLGEFIAKELRNKYTSIYITLNNCTQPGEADYKILKHIKDNKIDCDVVIHSCDSDFIFMIIWYQLLASVSTNSIEINLMMINYTRINTDTCNTLISGKKINNLLLEKYNMINSMNCTNVNINIVFDLLFILLMFGNDIIPPNYEIGTELNLKILFETHYALYHDNNFVVNINSSNIINFTNLSKWLRAIKNSNSFSIIVLNRFYKLPYNFIINMAKKYNIENIVNRVLIPFHIKQYEIDQKDSAHMNMDFRCNLKSSFTCDEVLDTINLNEYINVLNKNDFGLIRSERNYELDSNPFQSLYNYVILQGSNKTEDEFNRPYKIFFNNILEADSKYIELTKDCDTMEYLKLLIYIGQIFFYNFDLYTPYSLFNYSDMIAPSIDMILDFIECNDMNGIQSECFNTFSQKTPYFNFISHHLFITPYLLESNYMDSIKDVKYIESLLNVINSNIPGIWYKENEQFSLKKIDPYIFITMCNNMIKLYQDKFIDTIFKDPSHLLKE
jgi:hypothetical protein